MPAIRSVFREVRGAPFRTYRWDITWNNPLVAPGETVEVVVPYLDSDQAEEDLDPDEISFVQGRKDFTSPLEEGLYVDYELAFATNGDGDRVAICQATSSAATTLSDNVDITYWFRWYKSNEGGIATFSTVPVS